MTLLFLVQAWWGRFGKGGKRRSLVPRMGGGCSSKHLKGRFGALYPLVRKSLTCSSTATKSVNIVYI